MAGQRLMPRNDQVTSRDLAPRLPPESIRSENRADEGSGRVIGLTCIRCGEVFPPAVTIDPRGCPLCFSAAPANLRPVYARSAGEPLQWATDTTSMWRYAGDLPCATEDIISLGEGMTPLLPAPRIGALLGVPDLRIKDEGRNPTWSHKDRFSTVFVSVARAHGFKVVATASSGNAGASLAAYAARAGLDCVVATFAGSAGPMLAQIRKYGATVLPLKNKMDRWRLLGQAAEHPGWLIASPYHAPVVGSHALGIEGYKTIAYEIVEQSDGVAPDWCVLPCCYGDVLAGVWMGFQELFSRGVIASLPRLVAAEVHGSLSRALASGDDRLDDRAIAFDSLAVSIGAPNSTFQALKALRQSSGRAVVIRNDGLVAMQERLACAEGMFAELASVTPLCAIDQLRRDGVVAATDSVVAVVTASGLKDVDRSATSGDQEMFGSAADAWNWLGRNRTELLG